MPSPRSEGRSGPGSRSGPGLYDDLTWRGLVHQSTDQATMAARLDVPGMVLYAGFDPTADSLHIGHLQLILTLRRYQAAGHRPIALVGGGTGMIGDPSGKSEERNLLSPDQLAHNQAGIAAQLSRIIDFSGDGGALLVDNSEWLGPVHLIDFLRDVGKHFSVNEMIRKDTVRNRLEGREQTLSFTEFSYVLLQAWDFLQLFDRHHCELQLGGSDQWGNIVEGIDLIRRLRGAPAFGVTSPLVTKADGQKFGKTETGTVWLDPERTTPYTFFQFWLRTSDADVGPYLRRFTFLPRERIEELDAVTAAQPERREAQLALAGAVTSLVHGPAEAARAQAAGEVLFTDGIATLDAASLESALADAPSTKVDRAELDKGLDVAEALVRSGLAASRSEARRFVGQGAVYLNGQRVGEGRTIGLDDVLHDRWIQLRRGKQRQHVLLVD